MRTAIGVIVAALALAATGCGGSDEPERSPYAESLAALCDETRQKFEEVGEARELGYEAWAVGTIRLGQDFVKELDRLEPDTLEKARARRMRDAFDLYFRGTSFALGLYRIGDAQGFRLNQERANDILEEGEKVAVLLGAPECAERPFSDS